MIPTQVISILRHNTVMPGDALLAKREWTTLTGATPSLIERPDEIAACIDNAYVCDRIKYATGVGYIAGAWSGIELDSVVSLIRRSAFAQEIIVSTSDNEAALKYLKAKTGKVCRLTTEFGPPIIVCAAHYYIIESEGVVPPDVDKARLEVALESVLEPIISGNETPRAGRVRRARKTTLSLSHDLHIYKAKFFPRMVRALINIYGPDASIFDPFCGSGTALLEAALLGQDSYGVDIDPICALISRAKVAPFTADREKTRTGLTKFRRLLLDARLSANYEFPVELEAKLTRRDRIDGTNYLPEIKRDANIVFTALSKLKASPQSVELASVLASDAVTKKIRYRFIGVGNGKYTIEIIKQPLLERLLAKIDRCLQLAAVYDELAALLLIDLGGCDVEVADARASHTWPDLGNRPLFVVTSPPYLPASSGREHYAASRALAFSVLGMVPGETGYFDKGRPENTLADLTGLPASERLLTYLQSDAREDADPQRDAMRFERKAVPTSHYLLDIGAFAASLSFAAPSATLAMVVADQHTFYSHRRQEIEYVADCAPLYSEIMERAGLHLTEEIELQLLKSAASRAKPRSTDDYHEAVLIFSPKAVSDHASSSQQAA